MKEMSYHLDDIETEFCYAFRIGDIEKIREIHLSHPELLNNSSDAKYYMLLGMTYYRYDQITELVLNGVLNFVKFNEIDHIERHFESVLSVRNMELVNFFLKNGVKLSGSEYDKTPVEVVFNHKNYYNRRKEMLQLFFRYGLDKNFRSKDGQNLLHLFINSDTNFDPDREEIVEFLLNAGVPIDEPNSEGYTALLRAIKFYYRSWLVPILIKKGADVNKKCTHKELFPLLLAAENDETAGIVELLVSNGADVNAKSSSGLTALHVACDKNCERIFNFLMLKGADVSVEDNSGRTPFSIMEPAHYNPNNIPFIKIMIKEFAKRKFFGGSPVSVIDMKVMQVSSICQEYFRNCMSSLLEMAKTEFYPHYSYCSILKMSKNIKKLSKLVKNEKFARGFEKNSFFSFYNLELQRIYKEATELRDRSMIVYTRLCSIFGEFIPDVVVRKLSENLIVEDLPQE